MMQLSKELVPPQKPPMGVVAAAVRSARGGIVTTKPEAGYSDQTNWMIAVRDNRDKSAFGQLFDFYAPRLKAMILRNGISGNHAEDIVQDVMLSVWHKAAQFDPERSNVSAWVYQIARNRQIDMARKYNRPVPEALKIEDRTDEDADQIVGLEQETDKLRTAIANLPDDQREMVEKAYLGELSHSDIQDQTGLPLGTIKSRIRLGLQRLRHELKELR